MFKLPSYDWLRAKVNSLGNPDLHLPPAGKAEQAAKTTTTEKSTVVKVALDEDTYAIDIETDPFLNSPYNKLKVRSLQLDNNFYKELLTLAKKGMNLRLQRI